MCQGVPWQLGEKIVIKDVMETRSGECHFVCNQSKYKNIWVKGLSVWQKVPCGEKENGLPTVCVYLFVAKKRKEGLAEVDM